MSLWILSIYCFPAYISLNPLDLLLSYLYVPLNPFDLLLSCLHIHLNPLNLSLSYLHVRLNPFDLSLSYLHLSKSSRSIAFLSTPLWILLIYRFPTYISLNPLDLLLFYLYVCLNPFDLSLSYLHLSKSFWSIAFPSVYSPYCLPGTPYSPLSMFWFAVYSTMLTGVRFSSRLPLPIRGYLLCFLTGPLIPLTGPLISITGPPTIY